MFRTFSAVAIALCLSCSVWAQSSFQNSTPTNKSGVPTPATPQVNQSGFPNGQHGFNQGSNFNTKGNQWNSNNAAWQQNNTGQGQFSQPGSGQNQGSFRQNGTYQNNRFFPSSPSNAQNGQGYVNPTATTTPVASDQGYSEVQGVSGCNANFSGQSGVGFDGGSAAGNFGPTYYGRAVRPTPTYRRGGFFRGFWGR